MPGVQSCGGTHGPSATSATVTAKTSATTAMTSASQATFMPAILAPQDAADTAPAD